MQLYTPGYGHLLLLGCLFFPISFFFARKLVHFLLRGSTVARCPSHTEGASKKEDEEACGRCQLTQRKISSEIAERIAGLLQACISSVLSLQVILETRHDVMYSKSPTLLPYIHFIVPYFVVDVYAMYSSYTAGSVAGKGLSLTVKLRLFLLRKLPFIIHHGILLLLGYPLVVVPSWRNGLGDFFIGCFCFGELTNLFICTSFVLKALGYESALLFHLNGLMLFLTFLVSRLLMIPYMYWQYFAHEGAGWSLAALQKIPNICHFGMTLITVFQFYWFYTVTRTALKVVRATKAKLS